MQVKSRLLLDVVIAQGASILKELPSIVETLLIRGDGVIILHLYLSLDIINGIRRLDIKCDGLTSQSLDEDLHTSTMTYEQEKRGLLLDVVCPPCPGSWP